MATLKLKLYSFDYSKLYIFQLIFIEAKPLLLRLPRICLLLFSLSLAPNTQAELKTFTIGVDSWPPFRFVDQESVSGIDHELWQKLAKHIGFEINYFRCPWKRCLHLMKTGKIDAMSGLAWRQERSEYINYISPHYYSCNTRLYLLHGNSRRIAKHRDMHAMTIGLVNGSAYYEEFDQDDLIYKKTVNQEAILPDLLLEGRIEGFIGTDCQADYELAIRGLTRQIDKALFKPDNSVKLYIGLSARSQWLARQAEFDQALQKIREADFEGNALKAFSPFVD